MNATSSTTLRTVMEQLTLAGHLSENRADEIAQTISTQDREKPSPWYLQAIIGIAAWLAASSLMGFLTIINVLDSATSMMVSGSIFCIIAVGSRAIIRQSLFVDQLALALSLVGQVLLIGGIGWATDSPRIAAVALIGLELLLIVLYANALHRFLSTMIIPAALLFLLFDLEMQEMVHILIAALALGAVIIWRNESYFAVQRTENLYRPLGYGLVISLLYVLILSVVATFDRELIKVHYWWISSISLLLILLALVYTILTRLDTAPNIIRLIVIGTIIVFLTTLQAPGIVAAVLILVLGFQRGNGLLMGLATAFLALFLIIFYYNLELTLLTKSLMLMTTGLALFGLRFVLMRRFEIARNNREVSP